jgi:peptidyl-prolyl cis-trans isomerase B (cyclophilin B)
MTIDADKKYSATFSTSRGEIVCELFAKEAPKTVNNFVFLARDKFYDGTKFHRVLANFMIQGGDPEGSGRGGPGYRFEDETKGNPHKHKVGTLSMANAGPNTNGSQFFITRLRTGDQGTGRRERGPAGRHPRQRYDYRSLILSPGDLI